MARRLRPDWGDALAGVIRVSICLPAYSDALNARRRTRSATARGTSARRHHQGGDAACSVSLSVPRDRIERVIMDCVETNLLGEARLAELEGRYVAAATSPVMDHSRRIAELDLEVQNITDAIAKGLLSDALAIRLRAAEVERTRLLAAQSAPLSEARRPPPMPIEKRVALMRQRLANGGDIARSVLREVFPEMIWLSLTGRAGISGRVSVMG